MYFNKMLKIATVCCVLLMAVDGAIVKRETTAPPTLVVDFEYNMDYLRNCVDQSLASVVGHVNEQQLKPVFNFVGDTLNRISKTFEDLAVTTNGPLHIEKFSSK